MGVVPAVDHLLHELLQVVQAPEHQSGGFVGHDFSCDDSSYGGTQVREKCITERYVEGLMSRLLLHHPQNRFAEDSLRLDFVPLLSSSSVFACRA